MKGIREVLHGKDVLVTGGSGFMGKVLLEKLMRATNVRRIYLVIRSKRGLSPQTRINEMIKLPVFDLVRKVCPERLKILVPLEGELGQDNIGLSEDQVKHLEENIFAIFNFAASLKLEDPLKTLVTINTVATLKLLEMACKFKKLKVCCLILSLPFRPTYATLVGRRILACFVHCLFYSCQQCH
ncbi:putative fatty acyl-CoA reductase CG5065 [Halyomorpha halys]|uniref:putative fatty acyl-CoA reductase CG5065 n=1 Tax=Halyomorpha halys TaxID=286706 RepID=UPI0034D36F0F